MNVKKALKRLLTPYGQAINVGDLFVGTGKYGYVTKKGRDDTLNCYLFEIRWSTMTDELIQQVTSAEMKIKIKTSEWKHYSAYPKSRLGYISKTF